MDERVDDTRVDWGKPSEGALGRASMADGCESIIRDGRWQKMVVRLSDREVLAW